MNLYDMDNPNFAPGENELNILKYRNVTESEAKLDAVQNSSVYEWFKYANYVVQCNGRISAWSSHSKIANQRPALYMENQQLMDNCCSIVQRHMNSYDIDVRGLRTD